MAAKESESPFAKRAIFVMACDGRATNVIKRSLHHARRKINSFHTARASERGDKKSKRGSEVAGTWVVYYTDPVLAALVGMSVQNQTLRVHILGVPADHREPASA